MVAVICGSGRAEMRVRVKERRLQGMGCIREEGGEEAVRCGM